jgi:heptosyltransferase III
MPKSNDILVIRPGALGDTILTIPLIETISSSNPRANISWLGTGLYKSIIPPWIKFEDIESSTWTWLFEDKPRGRELHYRSAYIILSHPERIARNLISSDVSELHLCSAKPVKGEHIVVTLHKNLGFTPPQKRPVLRQELKRKRRIWLHPGSGGEAKCLDLEEWIHVVRHPSLADYHWVITMGDADKFVTRHPLWNMFSQAENVELLENQDLNSLRETLGNSELYMGNDSGISHFAAALGIPSIVVFKTTDPEEWKPWTTDSLIKVIDARIAEEPLTLVGRIINGAMCFTNRIISLE